MATKPTTRIPDWASGGTRTDPGAGKEASGWAVSERPPAQWWNWLLGAIGDWLTWSETSIDDLEDAGSKVLGSIATSTGTSVGSVEGVNLNIASVVSSDDSQGRVTVNFTTSFADIYYEVIVTPGISFDKHYFIPIIKTASACTIAAYDHATDSPVVLSSDVVRFTIDLKGAQ